MALPKDFQLPLTRKTITNVRKNGSFVQTSFLSGYYVATPPSAGQESRFAIIIGKVISKKAVVRNKIRRRMQEALLVASSNLPKERRVDMILYPKKGIIDLSKESQKEEVKKLLQQII